MELEAAIQTLSKASLDVSKHAKKLVILASFLLVAGVVVLQSSQTSYGLPSEHKFLNVRELQETTETQEAQQVQEIPEPKATKKTKFPGIAWAEYEAVPDYNITYWAWTIWNVPYTYDIVYESNDTQNSAKVAMDSRCFLNKAKSWIKAEFESDDLLRHEQGHYFIGSIFALNFKKKTQEMTFSNINYDKEISQLYETMLDEYLAMEIRYDNETNHFWNKTMQAKWEDDLVDQLNALEEYW